ncbi:MAG: GNAT family N-acetyltransferase [Candidatus Sulfotelmatobacter sp.]
MRLVLLKEIPEDANLRQQWDALVERMDQPQVFYTWEWARAVERSYYSTLRPLLFLAYDEQESLCGVAALAANTEGNQASFLCATTGDYCDFLSSPEQKPALVSAVLAELRRQGIGRVTLTNLPADSDTVAAVQRASAKNGYHYFARTAYFCAQVILSRLERRPGENRLVLPRKKMLRRFLNAMGREAPVVLDHARSWDTVESLLPQFIQAHVARFLATGRISNLARPERRVFLEELAKLLGDRGWLALTRMMSGADVFAWNYGFQFQGTWFWYQPTFDSALEKYSPGFCLLAKLVEEASDNPDLKVVDLGLGAEDYKDRFCNQTRETKNVSLNESAVRHYRETLRYYAAAIVKASPRAEGAARAIRQHWREIRERVRRHGTGATFYWLGKRFGDLLWSESEVFFCEWSGSDLPDAKGLKLQALSLNELASATVHYADDPETLTYLMRAAGRWGGNAEGFGVVDQAGVFLHFAWVTAFDGFFLSEVNAKVDAPSPDCVMLFDCWTPPAARGNGYYGQTVALVAKLMQKKGKKPWIFSAASNIASTRGLKKAGFQQRYSLVRRRALWWQRIKSKVPAHLEMPPAEVSAHV